MATTTYLALRYPALSNAPNVPQDMQNLASDVDAMLGGIILCTSSTRPTARTGAVIYETDTGLYQSYNGSAWVVLGRTVTGTYTPTLTAATTNPTLGTGGAAEGRYTVWNGKWCTIRGTILFGTASVSAGSGQYFMALPFNTSSQIANGVSSQGVATLRDSSTGTINMGVTYAAASASTASFHSGGIVTNAAPWTWAASDYISFTMTYEIA